MGRAEAHRIAAGTEQFAGLQVGDAEHAAKHGYIEMIALTGGAGLVQSGGHAEGGIQSRGEIGNRDAAFGRPSVLVAGDTHHAAHRLHRHVKAALGGAGARLAEGRYRAIHQCRMFFGQRCVVEAEFGHHAGAEIFDQHIGHRHQRFQNLRPFGLAEIEGDRLLVAGLAPPVQRMSRVRHRPEPAQRIADIGLFQLDDFGTEFAHQGCRERRGQKCRIAARSG